VSFVFHFHTTRQCTTNTKYEWPYPSALSQIQWCKSEYKYSALKTESDSTHLIWYWRNWLRAIEIWGCSSRCDFFLRFWRGSRLRMTSTTVGCGGVRARVGIVWSAGGTDAGWEWGFGSGDGAAEAGEPTDGTGTVSPRPLPPCIFGSGLGVKDWPWGYEGGPPDGVPEPPTNLYKEQILN
jgi:hypothetical protein